MGYRPSKYTCRHCNKEFEAGPNAKYCSIVCYVYGNTEARPEDPNECWLWTGPKDDRGYGLVFWRELGRKFAHRIAFTCFSGPIPDGKGILHSCHVRNCINPAHLRPGTHEENMRDMLDAGRTLKGRARLRLAKADVIQILESDKSDRFLAIQYGTTIESIRKVRKRETWRSLDE